MTELAALAASWSRAGRASSTGVLWPAAGAATAVWITRHSRTVQRERAHAFQIESYRAAVTDWKPQRPPTQVT
jgi:hypothetical protein